MVKVTSGREQHTNEGCKVFLTALMHGILTEAMFSVNDCYFDYFVLMLFFYINIRLLVLSVLNPNSS